jgi:hypothetical protein
VDITELSDLSERRGEPEPAGIQILPQQWFQAGLEEWGLAFRGFRYLLFVYVDRQYLVPEVRHADGMGEAQVSGPDDGDPRQMAAPPDGCSLTILTHVRGLNR